MCTWCDTICHTVDTYRSPDQGSCTCFQDTSTSATSVEVAMHQRLRFAVVLKQENVVIISPFYSNISEANVLIFLGCMLRNCIIFQSVNAPSGVIALPEKEKKYVSNMYVKIDISSLNIVYTYDRKKITNKLCATDTI